MTNAQDMGMRTMHILGILLMGLGWAGCRSTNAAAIDGGMDAGVTDVARCTDGDDCGPPPPPPTCDSCCPNCPPPPFCQPQPPPCPTCPRPPPPPFCPPQPLSCPGPGCPALGNLPVSRTLTLTPSDPIPSSLINEIQDNIIGGKRSQFIRVIQPSFDVENTANFEWEVKTINGHLKTVYTSANSGAGVMYIPFDDGDRIIGVQFDGRGDGIVDISAQASWSGPLTTNPGANMLVIGALSVTESSNIPLAAQLYGLFAPGGTPADGPFTPKVLSAGDLLAFALTTNGAGLSLGPMRFIFDRL